MNLSSPVTTISGVGPVMGQKLAKMGILTVFDLLYHVPFRYEDRTLTSPIGGVQPGETVTVSGRLDFLKNEYTRRGKIVQSGSISDASGTLPVVWFNQPFLTKNLPVETPVSLSGKVEFFGPKKTLVSPDYELISQSHSLLHTGRLVPVYPETAGVVSKWLRSKIFQMLNSLGDTPPFPPLEGFPDWKTALYTVHFPGNLGSVLAARKRLGFDELLILQMVSLYRKQNWQTTRLGHTFSVDKNAVNEFITRLPFSLTGSQYNAVSEILASLSAPVPMNRLLEGDVGSGKTVVAAVASLVAFQNGFQTLFLAPTQILANQHFETLSHMLKPDGLEISLITGAVKQFSGRGVVVGTHALLTQGQDFGNIGLVIIDEQHRFGVLQRSLAASLGSAPHILTMTATPIPRSVALTLYGDLDLSVLTDMPVGRLPVKTWLVPENKRPGAYKWIIDQIKSTGGRCFIVCPFIEDSETLASVKSATTEFNKLQSVFSDFRLGLLHGRLPAKEKNSVINSFRAGETQILVTTPVVEVGLDISEASIMVIEGAERFGLAQLHQLRGRVGRSGRQAYCLLFADKDSDRLRSLEQHHSGFELAEIDLKLRGPGEIFGVAQHGIPEFKVADLSDPDLISLAQAAAATLLPQLDSWPVLRSLVKTDKIDAVQPN